jgi:hypothetical protein
VAIKVPHIKAAPTQAPLKPRPPAQLPVIAPPGFALPEKRGWLLGGKK